MTDPNAEFSLAFPAYFHPAEAPEKWESLVRIAASLRFVIINVHNGPGEVLDPTYPPVIDALHRAGVRTVGYIDTDYGRRAPAEIGREVNIYRDRYGVQGVFMDQVTSGLDQLDHYAQCVMAARTARAPFVVLNPGTHPHPGYVDLANVTVTFEGDWAQYKKLTLPDWVYRYPSSRLCHLVHSLPNSRFADGLDLAADRHVDSIFLTPRRGANPWDSVPPLLVSELAKSKRERVNGLSMKR